MQAQLDSISRLPSEKFVKLDNEGKTTPVSKAIGV
jgi:hypothetical protein